MAATKKRIRPVIEEIIETPAGEPSEKKAHAHAHHVVEENTPQTADTFVQTSHEVAHYDEPAALATEAVGVSATHADHEEAARRLLSTDAEKPSRLNVKLVFLLTILTALIVGFISGGIYVYSTSITGEGEVETIPTPTALTSATPVPTATPSPKPLPALNTFSVNVLNGSGIIGAASKVKASLEAGGFKVTGTGNAQNYNFKNTVVQAKASVLPEVVTAVKNSLKDYVVEEGDALPASSAFDIVVTAGKE